MNSNFCLICEDRGPENNQLVVHDINNLAAIRSLLAEQSDDYVGLSEHLMGISDLLTDRPLTALYIPSAEQSFASFVVAQLGISLASLWLPVWKSGCVVLPASKIQDSSAQTLQELLFELKLIPTDHATPEPIQFSDNDSVWPVLEPACGRATQLERQLIENFRSTPPPGVNPRGVDFQALLAGLLLWFDELDASHRYSQAIEHEGIHRAGDYWHGIMHRREGDYGNSKYWFRNVGEHPIFSQLQQYACRTAEQINQTGNGPPLQWTGSSWDPNRFVDCCQDAAADSGKRLFATRLQAIEMVLLLRQTLNDACHA